MKITFKNLLAIALTALTFGAVLAQTNVTQNTFDGHYQRRNVSGMFSEKMLILENADLYINGSTGTYKYYPTMRADEPCFSKEVPIEVVKGNNEAITIRAKFPCQEQFMNFYHIVKDGKVGLSRSGSEVFEFEKVEKKPPLKLIATSSPNPTFDGQYEMRDYSTIRDGKPFRVYDANMTISGNVGTYKYINSVGLCASGEVPLEVSKLEGNLIRLIVKKSAISPSCKDNQIALYPTREDGVLGLVYEGATKLAFKKVTP
jgi:hypothetical protein